MATRARAITPVLRHSWLKFTRLPDGDRQALCVGNAIDDQLDRLISGVDARNGHVELIEADASGDDSGERDVGRNSANLQLMRQRQRRVLILDL